MGRRRKFEDEPDNNDRWLVSYADFITLLFAFFVVMYGISSVNDQKYKELTSALGSAFSGNTNDNTSSPSPDTPPAADRHVLKTTPTSSLIHALPLSRLQKERQRKEQESISAMIATLNRALGNLATNGKISISKTSLGVRIDIADGVLFQAGSAAIKAEADAPISEITQILADQQYAIQVEGHTDNVPISNAQFPSNWELSSMRATSVVRKMIENGIDAARLSAVGYSDTQPIADNQTAEGRAQNRRVSIMVLYHKPEKLQGAANQQ
ncbi:MULTISPECIES: flagellar motor protein MotD [Methylobacillus]|uniref:OmpA/MotB n=1 Tax=Methylobacillus flagellatus (strain ATCC 51484 / DSM 6875 / VKM B-1610 / KT) TaxID=265072 RepID=Q1GZX0_METFK|nr:MULTISPECIES: flagellar motor protein MotD [Methylobacillus]ABE50217.1 OmpA/MotB [Methylobacillus flagellatus KT]MPS48442.1 flagellar motor protein MotD [Methylobacillus sp.]